MATTTVTSYTNTQVDTLLAAKQDKTQLDAAVSTLVNTSGSATRAAIVNIVGTGSTGGGGGTTTQALALVTPPSISGTATVGQTLTAGKGTWNATPDSYTYQWLRSGTSIAFATGATYLLVAADAGFQISVSITAVKANYTSATATSAQTAVVQSAPLGTFTATTAPTISGTAAVGVVMTVSNGAWSVTPDSYNYQWKRSGANIAGATAATYTLTSADAGVPITAAVTANKSGYTAVTVTSSNTINFTIASPTNLIPALKVQNASDPTLFGTGNATVALNGTIAKSGAYSIQVAPDGTGPYPYVYPLWSNGAPVTPGNTYTGFLSVRTATAQATTFNCYLGWYDSVGNQISVAPSNAAKAAVQGTWVLVSSTGIAPASAAYAIPILENATAGLATTAIYNVDEFGVNAGTTTTWAGTPDAAGGGTGGGTPVASSITDTGFTYNGTWFTATAPTEHYTSTVGDTASVTFTLNSSATFSLLGKMDPSNGSISIATDGGTAITVSEAGTSTNNATMWTTTLAAGTHTVVVKCLAPDASIQGATVSNGTFAAPSSGGGTTTGGGGSGGTTSGNNTVGTGGGIIGGAAKATGSLLLPPTADAYPGYTQILTEDFDMTFAEGANTLGTALPKWNGYDGQVDGNVSGLTWKVNQISASGSVITMRNSNGINGCQALTPIFRNASNINAAVKAQSVLYGKFVIRLKARGQVGYKIAFLLWPTDDVWAHGEVDYPEGDLISPNSSTPYTMTANAHAAQGGDPGNYYSYQDSFVRIDDGKWHTCTIHWDSTALKFDMDGTIFHTVTDPGLISTRGLRWALQCETSPNQNPTANTAYVDIDWVAAYQKG